MIRALCLTLLLSGCLHSGALTAARGASDAEATVLLKTPCAVRYGAVVRLPKSQRAAVERYGDEMCR